MFFNRGFKKESDFKERREKKERRLNVKKKPCKFCSDKEMIIDYKLVKLLNEYLTERCKIVPRRMTGNCQFHQSRVVEAINRARHLALLPYSITHAVRE